MSGQRSCARCGAQTGPGYETELSPDGTCWPCAVAYRDEIIAETRPVERADIPAEQAPPLTESEAASLETYWSDRTAALAEALHAQKYGPIRQVNDQQAGASHFERDWERLAKDALLYLREHGWTLEREA